MIHQQIVLSYPSSKTKYVILLFISFILFSIVIQYGTGYMLVATTAYMTMIAGLLFRTQKSLHYKLMSSAIALDLGLVLVLEIKRHAINTALSFTLTPLQQAHIFSSSIATALYIPIIVLGILRLKGKITSKAHWHMYLGITAFVFRTLGFILMFSLIGK